MGLVKACLFVLLLANILFLTKAFRCPLGCKCTDGTGTGSASQFDTIVCKGLKKIPAGIPSNVRQLVINAGSIKEIPNGAFGSATFNKLLYFAIWGNPVEMIGAEAFKGFTNIQELSIAGADLKCSCTLKKAIDVCLSSGHCKLGGTCDRGTSLRDLRDRKCACPRGCECTDGTGTGSASQSDTIVCKGLNKIPAGIPSNVRQLIINAGSIKEIPYGAFGQATFNKLIYFAISGNPVEKIEAEAFKGFTNIQELSIAGADLKCSCTLKKAIDVCLSSGHCKLGGTCDRGTSLRDLRDRKCAIAFRCPLGCKCTDGTGTGSAFQSDTIVCKGLKKIPAEISSDVRQLIINAGSIKEIPNGAFGQATFNKLIYFAISGNPVEKIGAEAFKGFTNIQELSITGADLKCSCTLKKAIDVCLSSGHCKLGGMCNGRYSLRNMKYWKRC